MNKLFPLFALLFFTVLLIQPQSAADAARAGLLLSFQTAIPALLPYFIASSLLTSSGLAAQIGRLFARPFSFLYRIQNGAAAFLLGITGGYPVGARTVCDLYQAAQLSHDDAERLLGFCNNTGPAFILGVAGLGVCGSARTGFLLYGIHVLSAMLCGILLRGSAAPVPAARTYKMTPPKPLSIALVTAMRDGFSTSLLVAAFVTGFSILLGLCQGLGILSASPVTQAIFAGGLELTNGLMSLPALRLPRHVLLPLISLLLGFGGLSVHCQVYALAQLAGLSCRMHFIGKALHGMLAALLTCIVLWFAPHALPVFAPAGSPYYGQHLGSVLSAGIVLILLIKNTGKRR